MSCEMCVGFFMSRRQPDKASIYFMQPNFFINKHKLFYFCLKQRTKEAYDTPTTKRNCYFSSSFLQIILEKQVRKDLYSFDQQIILDASLNVDEHVHIVLLCYSYISFVTFLTFIIFIATYTTKVTELV